MKNKIEKFVSETGREYFIIYEVVVLTLEGDKYVSDRYLNKHKAEEQRSWLEQLTALVSTTYLREQICWID